MKKNLWLTGLLTLLTVTGFSLEGCDFPDRKTVNYLAPIGRFVLNPQSNDGAFAFSFLGEAGIRNFRLNGTAGTWTTERSRLKLGAEYLVQRLSWNYSSGKTRRWVQQAGVALDWQFLVDGETLKAVDINGFYSYAPTKHLSPERCPTANQFIERRIAGAQNYGGSFVTVFAFNDTSTLDLSAIYDYVYYRRHFQSRKTVAGFGGAFTFRSRLPGCVDFALTAEFRRPFNYYGVKFTWPKGVYADWTTSIFAGYTRGKVHLPRAVAVGLEFAYTFGGCNESHRGSYCSPLWDPCNLSDWVSNPAFYSPEVLAIRDEITTPIPG